MRLSPELIKKFVNVTNDSKIKKVSESITYGTVVQNGDKLSVRLDGATELTPIEQAMEAKVNDRVLVTIKNHIATVTGNITKPANNLTDEVNGVIQTVSSLDGDMQSKFQQLYDKIVLSVDSSGKIVSIELNADPETGNRNIILTSDNIKLEGYTTINGEFQILPSGRLLAKNANFEGTVSIIGNTGGITMNDGIVQIASKSAPGNYISVTPSYLSGYYYSSLKIYMNFQTGTIECVSLKVNGSEVITAGNIGNYAITTGNINSYAITPNNISQQSVNYAASAGSAYSATQSTNASNVNNSAWIGQFQVSGTGGSISFGGYGSDGTHTYLGASTVSAPTVNYSSHGNYSLRSLKENIKPFEECAIDIICDSFIRSYNFKDRKSLGDKKYVGLIVDEAPAILLTKDGNAIEEYIMGSIAWKAIQEQQEIINKQNTKISELEVRIQAIEKYLFKRKQNIFCKVIKVFRNKKERDR